MEGAVSISTSDGTYATGNLVEISEWNGDRFRKWADSIGINTSSCRLQYYLRQGRTTIPAEAAWDC